MPALDRAEAFKLLKEVLHHTNAANIERLTNYINLIASENIMSPLAVKAYTSDFMYRYAEGKPFKRYYQGTFHIDVIEDITATLFISLSGALKAEVRPVSGTIANAAVFRVLAEPGDKAVIAPVQAGAHVSHTKFGTLGALGIQHIEMPYDAENMNVDVDKAVKLIEEVKPKFAVLGGSVYLFPHPTKEIASAIHAIGGKLVYDAAHVLGLILGGAWPNPLELGADAVTGSTHKTLPGPQGGVILFNDKDLYKKVSKTIFPWFLSNHHLHRLPATAITLIEMALYGQDYARNVVDNARRLAESLASEGLDVVAENLGYTRSHQVLVDVRKWGRGAKNAQKLEEAGIILNKNLLPWDKPEDVNNPSGLRIGVQEVTRWGMGKNEMDEIARFIADVVLGRREPASVRRSVIEFRRQFTRVHYALDDSEYALTTILDLVR